MNPLEGLAQYLDRLERRLRLFTWTRGAAAIAGAALILTVLIVAVLMEIAFSPVSLIFGRFVLFLGIGGAAALVLVIPLMRMNRRRAAREVEQRHPGFDQRLLTFTERSRDNAGDPFLPLLAEDALVIARQAEPERLIDKKLFLRFGSLAAAAAGVLVYLVFWGPGVFGYGTSLLWGSYGKDQSVHAFYSINVQPGSRTIRRNSDQQVTATTGGFTSGHAVIYVQYASAAKWEQAPMEPVSGSPSFGFLLVRVPEDVQYYVEAGGIKSPTYKLHTIDLPAIKNIHVTYNYPSWTGMSPVTEDPGGDLRAVEGTVAKLDIRTDKALSNAEIVFDDEGKKISLDPTQNNLTSASVPIEKDGTYHIAVMDHGELVRLTDDYFVEARKVGPPTVRIVKPVKDAKVSPIEEVTVQVSAEDEFPLQGLDVHYSVNGAPEKVQSLLKEKGVKQSDGTMLLSLEDFKLVPGDIVSLYATAKDGKNSAKTDMYFIQAVPFEFKYTQSQAGGGGGDSGGMDQDQQISEREKEIIAATFNQLNGDAKIKAAAADNGKYLGEVQAKLRDQAQSLANRMKARQLDGSGAAFQQFVKEMETAVASMTPASDRLKSLAFQDAMTPEQQALQHLLRAESTFRQIQIQISRGGGGGGGGGGGAGRDLANLFDLELDKDKNQYEQAGGGSSAEQQKQQQIDEAMKKLDELSKREQQLAEQQQNNPQQIAQQRYQQEMLRREAEDLKRQLEQLQQQGQQNQEGQQSQSQASSSSQSGQSGQPGQASQQQSARNQQGQRGGQQQQALNRAMSDQLQRAIHDVEQAEKAMSSSTSARQPGQQSQQGSAQAEAEAQQAAQQLKDAGQKLQALRHQQTGNEMGDLADKASQLASQQQDFEQRLRRNFGQGQGSQQTAQQMANEKQNMIDQWNQLQKQMQQAARDTMSAQPNVSKDLRDTMGKSQQQDVATRMEWTQEALRRGLGQYAVLQEAPVTRSLNELRDDLKKLEAESAATQGQAGNDDKSQIAMQQALNQADQVRRDMEQLTRGQQGQKGQGQQGRQGLQQGQGQGQSQQAGGRQNRQSPQGGGNPNGGGYGVNNGPRNAYGGAPGSLNDQPYDAYNFGGVDPRMGKIPPASPEAAYNDLMRDIGRLRNSVTDDKDLAREFQDLLRRAQELDPRHMNDEGQLGSVIGQQAMSQLDEVEYLLRRKLAQSEGAVRSTSPRTIPPGYADAVAEYTKKLSQQ